MKINDGLELQQFPEEYLKYMEEETELVRNIAEGNLLDVGCGRGRIMPQVEDSVEKYVGIDNNPEVLHKAREVASKYANATVHEMDAEDLSDNFETGEFDTTICLFNTLGCMEIPEKVLEEMGAVSKDKILLTLAAKGSLQVRREYYEQMGIDYEMNPETETITSPTWGESRAYDSDDLENICERLDSELVEEGRLGTMMIYGLYRKE